MSAVLQEPAPAVVPAVVTAESAALTVRQTVVALFRESRPVLERLAARYEGVAVDVSTPKGLADAKAARHDLRENGRFAIQRTHEAMKKAVNALKPVIEAEADALIAIVQPTEDSYDAVIKAREEQMAAEKAERDRLEAERRAKHEAGIARLQGYVEQARGKDSATIQKGIEFLAGMAIGPEWEEFADRAETVRMEVVARLGDLHAAAVQAEAAAAERERQRLENERRAAELAEQERALTAQRAELARLEQEARDRIAALEQEAADREAARAAQAEVAARASRAAAEAEAAAVAPPPEWEPGVDVGREPAPAEPIVLPPAPPPLCEATIASTPGIAGLTVIEEPAEAPATPAVTITAGQIGTRLGFRLTAEFIETTLGVTRLEARGAAVLWSEAAWPAIKDALVAHVLGLQ